MKITNQDLAAIHGYLCSDGYVITNPPTQKHKYYHIGLRNINVTLLEDFQQKFFRVFGIEPIIYRNERCKVQSKKIYLEMLKYGSFYSDKWQLPDLSLDALSKWLRAYFDCDGWAYCEKHQNRHIGLESINKNGILQIKDALQRFGVDSIVKNRVNKGIWKLYIYRRKSLQNFEKHIGFLHPEKAGRLKDILKSYVEYTWKFPEDDTIKDYITKLMEGRARIQKNGIIRVNSIIKINLIKLKKHIRSLFGIESKVYGPRINGYGTKYYELAIQKKSEVSKVKNIFLD